MSSYKVKDILIEDVFSIHRGDKLRDAAHTMIGAHVSCLIVLDNYKPIGIITERDFVKKLNMIKGHTQDLIVDDLMTKKLFTVSSHISLFEAEKIMRGHNFRKLIIVENEELKGIITQTDLCKVLAKLKSPYPKPPLIEDVMTKDVLKVCEEDSFLKAKQLMAVKDIGSVLVAEKAQIRGIFTEFDIASEFFLNPNRLRGSNMKDLMASPVICISPGFDLFQVNDIMLEHNFRRLPVMSDHHILGIITQTDVARNLYAFIEDNKDYVPGKRTPKLKKPKYIIKKKGSIILYEKA